MTKVELLKWIQDRVPAVREGVTAGATGYLDGPAEPTASVMKGFAVPHGRPFLTLCLRSVETGDGPLGGPEDVRVGVTTVFQRYDDVPGEPAPDVVVQACNTHRSPQLFLSAATGYQMLCLSELVMTGRTTITYEDKIVRRFALVSPAEALGSSKGRSPWVFSSAWTDADKLRLCVLMTDVFRDDFAAGRYGLVGRPNVQSLHELIAMGPEELEKYRGEIETIADAHHSGRDIAEALAARKRAS